eukprot:CAMPEP_0119352996 /NCGR_PEP_ID=MMETSP1334-20130426/2214_1 /TAXON_ID=127549 /ORGANISM="Calcidiscus leptoporus, Strain RCC1130" /LENGTH=80 /DNA_ID=CAMNT_0007366171 /DNA_START=329 /DNA_END=567 /DNA_ORIENTATION=+
MIQGQAAGHDAGKTTPQASRPSEGRHRFKYGRVYNGREAQHTHLRRERFWAAPRRAANLTRCVRPQARGRPRSRPGHVLV